MTIRHTALVLFGALACVVLSANAAAQGDKKIEQLKEKGEFTADTAKDDAAKNKDKNSRPSKLYAVPMVAGRTYTILMRSDEFDAYIRLEDPSGKTIKEDDDSGGGTNRTDAQIVYKADKTGNYTIVATSYNTGAKGKYTLTVTHDGVGADDNVKYLIDVKAKLTKDDPKDKARGSTCYCKTYKIEMTAKSTYVIQLDSREFDAYIRLVDSEGKQVAQDDDGALDGLNAKLVYNCDKSGVYTIVATTFAHPDTGEFHLRVSTKK